MTIRLTEAMRCIHVLEAQFFASEVSLDDARHEIIELGWNERDAVNWSNEWQQEKNNGRDS